MTEQESAVRAKAAIDILDTKEILMAAEENHSSHFEAVDSALDKLRKYNVPSNVIDELSCIIEASRVAWGDQRITDCIKYLK